ncbi:hypothetical protein NL676_021793 [Syzygium grande]|nr:hypothetical protein NL676_021793 [Syzygium grande]
MAGGRSRKFPRSDRPESQWRGKVKVWKLRRSRFRLHCDFCNVVLASDLRVRTTSVDRCGRSWAGLGCKFEVPGRCRAGLRRRRNLS